MRFVILAAFAAALALSQPARADGMYHPPGTKDSASFAAPPLWTGFYLGGSAGFGAGDTTGAPEITAEDLAPLDDFDEGLAELTAGFIDLLNPFDTAYELSGAVYGAHLGYNKQRGHVVFGLEAGLYGADLDGETRCVLTIGSCSRDVEWYGTLVARLGYAVDRVMFYGLGGLAYGKVATEVDFGLGQLKDDARHTGWTAGLGLEYAMTDRFFIRVEYAHVDLGEETINLAYDLGLGEGSSGSLRSDTDVAFDTIKIGASFKLGDRRAYEPLK